MVLFSCSLHNEYPFCPPEASLLLQRPSQRMAIEDLYKPNPIRQPPDAALAVARFHPSICRTQSLVIIIHDEKAGIQVEPDFLHDNRFPK
jgi:hypothetical protein